MKRLWTFFCAFMGCATALFAQNNYFITSADSTRLYINEYGTGKPVILLSGGPGLNAHYLEPVWQQVKGCRFIVPDQRGTGRSVLPQADSVTMAMARHVEDLEALRIHLQLPKMIIAGHSWGAMLAVAYAARYPDKTERLILLAPGGITARFFTYFNANIQMRLYKEDKEEAKNARGMAAGLKAIWPGYFYSRERALALKQLLDTSFANAAGTAIYRYTIKDYNATEAARLKGLHKYKNPVFLIQGRQDPVGESTVYETKALLPQMRFTFIEKCGHLPWLEEEKVAAEFFRLLNAALTN